MQLFFVYDTSYCKTETDDPGDAIIYFYPPQILEPQRCTICCQLMGAVQFFQSTFSCPKIITLQKGKFAIKQCSRYLLVLEANSAVPDVIIIKQLENLYNIYQFYHKDIDRICKIYSNNRSGFLQKMKEIWNCCFPVSCAFDNDFFVAFNAVPAVIIPEAVSAFINIQALQLLQSCQWHGGIIAGCVLFKHQILVTQFSSEINRFLTIVKFLQDNFSPEDVPVPFQLPPGVRIIRVFVQKNILCHIAFANSYHKKQSEFKLHSSEKLNSYLSDEVGSGSEGDIDSDTNCESAVQNSVRGNKKTYICKRKDFHSSMRRKHFSEDQDFHCDTKCDKNGEDKNGNLDYNTFNYKCYDNECSLRQNMQQSKTCAMWEGIVNLDANDFHEMDTQHASTSQKGGDIYDIEDTLQEMCLFIQSYLNCIVIFLMEPKFVQNIELIQSLWNSGLSVLSELEVLIQCHTHQPSKGKPKSYTFVCLENQGRSLDGFPPPESYNKQHNNPVFKTIQHIHGDFESNPHLLDVSTVACGSMVHACRSPIHEAFYHEKKQEINSLSSHFTSVGSLPLRAVRRLEKSLGIFLP